MDLTRRIVSSTARDVNLRCDSGGRRDGNGSAALARTKRGSPAAMELAAKALRTCRLVGIRISFAITELIVNAAGGRAEGVRTAGIETDEPSVPYGTQCHDNSGLTVLS